LKKLQMLAVGPNRMLKTAVTPVPINDGSRGSKANPGDIWNQMVYYIHTQGLDFDTGQTVKGVANPNIPAQFSDGTLVVNQTPPLTFNELSEETER
jgi:hypothetical protein